MNRKFSCLAVLGLTSVLLTPAAKAEFTELITDFEGFGVASKVIFQNPQFSGSTQGILLNTTQPPPGVENNFTRVSNFGAVSGLNEYEIKWIWGDDLDQVGVGVDGVPTDPTDPYDPGAPYADADRWIRLTSSSIANLPNPTVHLQGKVRFKILNDLSTSFGIGLIIRETGESAGLGEDGSTSGDLEFVGVDGTHLDALNDVVPEPTLIINNDANVQIVEFDLAALSAGGKVLPFANNATLPNTADGVLDATAVGDGSNRGVLEAIFITHVAGSGTDFDILIDDIEFTSPVLDPPRVKGPVIEFMDTVVVDRVDSTEADGVELFINGNSAGTATAVGGEATFTGLALDAGDILTATQTIGAETSEVSAELVVNGALAWSENFDSYADLAAFDAVWAHTVTDDGITLANDFAASCPNSARENAFPTGGGDPWRRYVNLATVAGGELNGSDDVPLWITWYFRHGTGGGQRNYIQFYSYTGGVFASGSLTHLYILGCYNATTGAVSNTGNYQFRDLNDGGPNWVATNQARKNNQWVKMQLKLTTSETKIFIDDVEAGFLDAAQPNPYPRYGPNDPITAIALGSGLTNANIPAWFDNLSLSFGPTAIDPFGPPLNAPQVDGPLLAGDTSVALKNVELNASEVRVYANGVQIGSLSGSPINSAEVSVPVTALVAGDAISAQVSVGSDFAPCAVPSTGPIVGEGNTEVKLTMSIRDKTPLDCVNNLFGDGATGGQLEWVGAATSIGGSGGAPQGKPLSPSPNWQPVEFRVATGLNDDVIYPSPGFAGTGNGVIDNLPCGVIEHLAVSINEADPNTGPYTMYIDDVMNGTNVLTGFEEFAVGDDERLFRLPGFSGSTDVNLHVGPNLSQVTDEEANTGDKSLKLNFQFRDEATNRWVRITTVGALSLANPIVDLTQPITMMVLFPPSSPVDVDPPVLASALSRKNHTGVGDFDIPMDLGATGSTIESRTGGPTQVVMTFNEDVAAIDGTFDCGEVLVTNATCTGVSGSGADVTVSLSGASGCVIVTLGGIEDLAGNPLASSAQASVVSLPGDASPNYVVNIVDLNEVKGDLFQAVDQNNFRSDVNADGVINIIDLNATKGELFTTANCGP